MTKVSAFARLKKKETPPQVDVKADRESLRAAEQGSRQASRIGRKTVIFYDLPEAVREIKRIGVDNDRTIQDLMHEAVDDLLVKYGKHAFGSR